MEMGRGFPTGVSGQELAARAYLQAQKFGADILVAKATRLICDRKPYVVELENGARISTRTVVIATGAQYRKLPLENLSRFEGAGIDRKILCRSAVLMIEYMEKNRRIEQTEDYNIYRRRPANKKMVIPSYNDFGL